MTNIDRIGDCITVVTKYIGAEGIEYTTKEDAIRSLIIEKLSNFIDKLGYAEDSTEISISDVAEGLLDYGFIDIEKVMQQE